MCAALLYSRNMRAHGCYVGIDGLTVEEHITLPVDIRVSSGNTTGDDAAIQKCVIIRFFGTLAAAKSIGKKFLCRMFYSGLQGHRCHHLHHN